MRPVSTLVQLLLRLNCERAECLKEACMLSIPLGGLFLSYRDKTSASAHIQNAMYADDMALIAESRREVLTVLNRACEQWGTRISVEKTKILAVAARPRASTNHAARPSHRES